MKNLKEKKLVRLGQIYVYEATRDKLKSVGEKEMRAILKQASYVLEQWASS